MIRALSLLVPVLMPSWRFFAVVAPSPMIEFAVRQPGAKGKPHWQEFRPRPQALSLLAMARRLFWNPQWTETLFLTTCTERYLESEDPKRLREILTQVRQDVGENEPDLPDGTTIQCRFVAFSEIEGEMTKVEIFRSDAFALESSGLEGTARDQQVSDEVAAT